MRTQGTFQEVYDAAKAYYNETAEDGSPHSPVIRREGNEWMLESSLDPANEDCNVELTLEEFDSYFYETYKEKDYTPTTEDIEYFVAQMTTDEEEI